MLSSILGWASGDSVLIVAGNSGYTTGSNSMSAFTSTISDGQLQGIGQAIPGTNATSGPVAAADYDQDGDLDFFIGGRFRPGRYPENASSQFIKMDNSQLNSDRPNTRRVRSIGLVTGAVFSDYDRDGDPDLLLSRAWNSILLLENDEGIFRDVALTLDWELTKDGGTALPPATLTMTAGRISWLPTSGPTASINCMIIISSKCTTVTLTWMGAMISLKLSIARKMAHIRRCVGFKSLTSRQQQLRHIQTHEQFANATLQEIFNRNFDQVPSKKINTLQHMLFVNTADGFQPQPLPTPIQWTAAFYAGVADYNNDGNDDLFLSQNVFDLAGNRKRLDTGRGRWMRTMGREI